MNFQFPGGNRELRRLSSLRKSGYGFSPGLPRACTGG